MKTPCLLLGLLAAAVSLSGVAAEKVYKWTDGNGIVHFSDTPPPQGTNFDNVNVASQANAPATDTKADDAPPASDPNGVAKTAPDKAQRCADARSRVSLLSSPMALSVNQGGKTVPLDPAQRAAELNIAKATVDALCTQETAER